MNELGHYVRTAREMRSLTIRELAEMAKSSIGYICDLENGRIKKPSALKIVNLASALDVDIEVLACKINR
jgi:transcriptional regulator with XRE-family HTH domain